MRAVSPRPDWRTYGPELKGQRRLTVAEVLRHHGPGYLERFGGRVSPRQDYVLRQLLKCRQPAQGSFAWHCPWCGHRHLAYQGCGNRHCGSCGKVRRCAWLEMMRSWTLPVSYLHIIFTLPHELNPLILANAALLYNLQFEASIRTLMQVADEISGSTPGMSMVLHTWGQAGLAHPHTHVLQTAGGLRHDGQCWVPIAIDDPAYDGTNLAERFRKRYLKKLLRLYRQQKLTLPPAMQHIRSEDDLQDWLQPLRHKRWQARCDGPPSYVTNSDAALKYLSRYVMGAAINDARVLHDDGRDVVIRIRDYRAQKMRPLKMSGEQFVERYLLHILPKGFQRVRHAGLFTSRFREENLARCRELLEANSPSVATELTGQADDSPFDGDEDVAPDATPKSWERNCPRCRLPMQFIGILDPLKTSLLLASIQALWRTVTTRLDVSASPPTLEPSIQWSCLDWSITTADIDLDSKVPLPPPDT